MSVFDWMSGRIFNLVHRHNLVYNTCWEDPRLDRVALKLTPQDNVLVITSAGCNALDYALCAPNHVYAVDMNPRQNALLELKLSAIRNLEYPEFYHLFGNGRLGNARQVYETRLRGGLSPWSQSYWDRWIRFFEGQRRPFYFRGTSGTFARAMNFYVDRVVKLRPWVDAILDAKDVDQQRQIYEEHIRKRFWSKSVRFMIKRDTALSMLGVPRAQRIQVEKYYEGGIARFIQDSVEAVFAKLPLSDNYFWRVYMNGRYEPHCCPEYLKPENFARLKAGLADRVSVHTASVQGFLEASDARISRFVLLDHMDWLSGKLFPVLEAEWQAILGRAAPGTRVIWRSGGLKTDFVDRVRVACNGRRRELGELLTYDRQLADELHPKCRVHTYGSFYIADLAV